jgi:hypothetical protein
MCILQQIATLVSNYGVSPTLTPQHGKNYISRNEVFIYIFLQLSPAVNIAHLSWFVIRKQLYKIAGFSQRKLSFIFSCYRCVTRILTWNMLVADATVNKRYRMNNANILSQYQLCHTVLLTVMATVARNKCHRINSCLLCLTNRPTELYIHTYYVTTVR